MKKDKLFKIFKLTLIISVIILISLISFIGIYIQDKGEMKNILPEYILTKELKGSRRVVLSVNNSTNEETGEKINSEESLNTENYIKSKEIMEKRIKAMGLTDYIVRQNEETGEVIFEFPENDSTDHIIGNLPYAGKFEIVDDDTGEVLMTNDDLDYVVAGYGSVQSGTTAIIINIQFNKEGTEKFKNITNTYVQTTETNETPAEGEDATKTVTKQIAIKIEDSRLLATYFDKEISDGLLQLTMAKSSSATSEEMQEYLIEANELATLMGSGKMPVVYTVSQNKYIYSEITENIFNIGLIICISILAIALIYVIIRYKVQGILLSLSLIGYAALLLIAVRYFNVEISIGAIIALIFSIGLDYAMTISILNKNSISKATKKYCKILIPTLMISIVLTFNNMTIGPALFWGLLIMILYNISVTKLLIED